VRGNGVLPEFERRVDLPAGGDNTFYTATGFTPREFCLSPQPDIDKTKK
jgi:hypothetical protein